MDKKKVTRRAAIGAAIGGVAAAPFILRALRGRYEVATPDGPLARTVGGKITLDYEGHQITIEVPRVKLETLEDRDKLAAAIVEELKKDPKVVEVNNLKFEQWKEASRKRINDRMDEEEKRQLEELAKLPWGEEEKRAAAKKLTEQVQACRTQLLSQVDEMETPPLE